MLYIHTFMYMHRNYTFVQLYVMYYKQCTCHMYVCGATYRRCAFTRCVQSVSHLDSKNIRRFDVTLCTLCAVDGRLSNVGVPSN